MNNKKEDNRWLVAVVVAIFVMIFILFISGFFFTYKMIKYVSLAESEGKIYESHDSYEKGKNEIDEFEFDFEYDYKLEDFFDEGEVDEGVSEEKDNDDFEDTFEYSYGNEKPGESQIDNEAFDPKDYSYVDEKNGKTYYTELKDAIRYDLDYFVDWQDYNYDTDYENVTIYARYPQLDGSIPNLEYINSYITDEISFWVESFEEFVEESYFQKDDRFTMVLNGYVTYMDGEKISIVYSESGWDAGESINYLFSINVDVQNGVILQNASIMNMDDDFAVEFRERNREQNDASGFIDELTDQEIVEYLNSPTLGAVFYTPLGMEVGINLDYGWYTVTYSDYEKYLKKL